MLNLDTHILIHALEGDLKAAEERLLARNAWSISAIVLWEIAKLSQLGRIEIDIDDASFSRVFASVHIWPIDLAITRKIRSLDFRSDPADEIIVATSLVHGVPLVTRDRLIRQSKVALLA